jgi:FAD/FMN-containing dehydrogenase
MSTAHKVAREATEALRNGIRGDVFVPGEPGYDQSRQAWTLAVDQRPAVVVEAESAADVIAAVLFARSEGLRIAPQGTGHGAGPHRASRQRAAPEKVADARRAD